MYYLTSIDRCHSYELEGELRDFFSRLHHLKRNLQQERAASALNRIQRMRCRQNIMAFERLERDFHALSHPDDLRHLYRRVHRYVKLDQKRLMHTFGHERVECRSLFVAL
ncbi:MAG: hypothetical protein L3J47_01730 [Sulfurovum sp.]|nr:hypothetical protein [Sulfurovum sp.]